MSALFFATLGYQTARKCKSLEKRKCYQCMSLLFPVTFHYFRVFHTILFCSALFYFLFFFIFIFCLVIFIREIGMKADVLSSNLENFLFHIICFYLYLFTQIILLSFLILRHHMNISDNIVCLLPILLSFLILRHHMNISDNIVCLLACYQCLLFLSY